MKLNERYSTFEVCEALDKASKSYREVFKEMKAKQVHKMFFDTMESDGLICEDPKSTVVFTRALDGKRFEGEVKLSASYGGTVSPCWVQKATYTAYANTNFTAFTVYNEQGRKVFERKAQKTA
jgi:hypothetical protein